MVGAVNANSENSRGLVLALCFIAALCFALGGYAEVLNAKFYAHNQPFWDSMSYHNHVREIILETKVAGLGAALQMAGRSTTVFLPLAIAAFAGLVFEPSRSIGIWIQVGELLILSCSLLYYLSRIRKLPTTLAILAITPFLILRCFYHFNGGLSDFRMDLSLYLLFATTVLWYLIARETRQISHFAVLGIVAGATCLFRATAPVYLVVSLLPPVLHRLWTGSDRHRQLAGLGLAVIIAAASSLWFYVYNFSYLHYYYVVWNTDANAKLPLAQSIGHFGFVAKHIGLPTLVFALSFQTIIAVDAWINRRQPAPRWLRLTDFNWELLWIGIAPALLLVLRGAGLNPFVCMPSVFGLTLILILPTRMPEAFVPAAVSPRALAAILLVALGCCVPALRWGWKDHRGDAPNSMEAHRQVLTTIARDARQLGQSQVRFATTHLFYLNTISLQNVAVFDYPNSHPKRASCEIDGVELMPNNTFTIGAEANWREIPGATADEKLNSLLLKCENEIDYVIIPEESTATFLEQHISHDVINRYSHELRRQLLASRQWLPISNDIKNNSNESVRVYRRSKARVARR